MTEPRTRFWNRVATRTRDLLEEGLRGAGTPLEDGYYDELEELLVGADFGPQVAADVTSRLRSLRPNSNQMARHLLESELTGLFAEQPRWLNIGSRPSCVLLYGVNGAGKTTTAGKLAHGLKRDGRKVLLVAADTYRAAGIEQAQVWAERAGVECFAGRTGGDPAAVVFDALKTAQARAFDVAVVDTAGRLQTQQNLLQELGKVARVAGRALEGAPHESLLVLDGVLGQSSLGQARGFHAAVPVTGLVLAKMDGTARGGAVVAIERDLRVPAKMIGVGEAIDDLYAFDPERYVSALLGEPG